LHLWQGHQPCPACRGASELCPRHRAHHPHTHQHALLRDQQGRMRGHDAGVRQQGGGHGNRAGAGLLHVLASRGAKHRAAGGKKEKGAYCILLFCITLGI
jgi:hypothetical protein